MFKRLSSINTILYKHGCFTLFRVDEKGKEFFEVTDNTGNKFRYYVSDMTAHIYNSRQLYMVVCWCEIYSFNYKGEMQPMYKSIMTLYFSYDELIGFFNPSHFYYVRSKHMYQSRTTKIHSKIIEDMYKDYPVNNFTIC